MRVLLVPYPGSFELVGGHATQQRETAQALTRAGLDARIGTIDDALAGSDDIVHFFGDVRPLLSRGRPRGRLVVSPIYFPRRVLLGPVYWQGGRRPMLRTRLRHRAAIVRHLPTWRRRLADFDAMLDAWRAANAIVVNSEAEKQLLLQDGGRFHDVRVAHSGVAASAFGGDPELGRKLLGIGNAPFILSVARVEPIKNQLSLALATRQLPYVLVLVGAVLPGNERYFKAVQDAAPNVVHIPHVDHDLLPNVHAAAAAHVLPSWFETTGLSSLEAMAAGRPAVVSGGPCVDEYFGSCAAACRPHLIGSIAAAIERAAAGPAGCEIELARRYSWDATATALIAAYSAARLNR